MKVRKKWSLLDRFLITGIIFIFANSIYIPCFSASNNLSLETNVSMDNSADKSNFGNNEKPDLIIEDIIKEPNSIILFNDFYCRVRNIGDATTVDGIEIDVDIIWMLFGKIPLKTVKNYVGLSYPGGGLKPGQYTDVFFTSDQYLPKFGSYKISAVVNPDGKILEKDFSNNFYDETFFVMFGNW